MSEVNVLDNTTGWVFILVGILVILIGAVMLAVFVWLGFKRPKYRKEHFTGHTTGTVERMSNIYSCNIRVPLVSYSVEGQTYKVAGPRFAACTTVFADVAGMQVLSTGSNITVDGELPTVVKMKGNAAAAQAAMESRYPVGKSVDVFYDPDKPKKAFVERDAPLSKTLSTILSAVSAAVSVIGLVILIIGIVALTR